MVVGFIVASCASLGAGTENTLALGVAILIWLRYYVFTPTTHESRNDMRASYITTPQDKHTTCPSCRVLRIVRSFKGEVICGHCQKDGITSAEFAAFQSAQIAKLAAKAAR